MIKFVENIEVMEALEKRDYIHSHLHLINEKIIDEMYQKMYSKIEDKNSIVGYDAFGKPITKQQLLSDLEEAERQIERGDYVTIEELEAESKSW